MAFGDRFLNGRREVGVFLDRPAVHVEAATDIGLERILVVDDGAGNATQLRMQLELDSGDLNSCQVDQFTNPLKALERARSHSAQNPWNPSELKKLLANKISQSVPVVEFKKQKLPKPTITTLRTAPLLAELPLHWVERLAGVAEWQVHSPNDILIRQNELSNSVYFVIAGYLKTIRGGVNTLQAKDQGHPDRRVRKRSEVMLALLGPGDMLGEVGYLLQIERPASVVALTPCQVIRIPGQEFLACIHEHPNFALAVTRKIAWQLLGSIHQLELMRGDLEGRIHALIRRCKSMGMDTERWLTNAEIARMVGATRVGVSQIMGRINRDTQDTESSAGKSLKA